MSWARTGVAFLVAAAAGLVLVSGGSEADPETPRGLSGMPPPFLGTAVFGSGGLTGAVDAYGDVVDLRAPGPAGQGLIDNSAQRQAAGTVPADTGIVPRVRVGGTAVPMWRADSIAQRYLPGTNVVRTAARFRWGRVVIDAAARAHFLGLLMQVQASAGVRAIPQLPSEVEGLGCRRDRRGHRVWFLCSTGELQGASPRAAMGVIRSAAAGDRRWLEAAQPLGAKAPPWARAMYRRSLLVLRALTDARTGAVAAGARDGWAYVWPRDAGAAALAYAAAGYRMEARRVASFLLGLDLAAAARFAGSGDPVPGRGAQGDAAGWVRVAARAAGLPPPQAATEWRDLPDYQEGSPGDYLGNALAAADPPQGEELVRRPGDPDSGLDSASAWAVRPFSDPALYPNARKALGRLAAERTRFGITPSGDWPGEDPWSAPTAWTAWSLAALGERRQALQLMRALRRSATPAGALPERVDAQTGIPRSTTPLAWSHAFALLALRELWPS
jgi:hypothetical protein